MTLHVCDLAIFIFFPHQKFWARQARGKVIPRALFQETGSLSCRAEGDTQAAVASLVLDRRGQQIAGLQEPVKETLDQEAGLSGQIMGKTGPAGPGAT